MKTFKKVSKAIRNVDEREGHAEATAAFIDAEFSDNSGKVVKALRSKSAWKRSRVNAICEKAAVIMEDRCAHAHMSGSLLISLMTTTGSACTAVVTPSLTRSCNANSNVSTVGSGSCSNIFIGRVWVVRGLYISKSSSGKRKWQRTFTSLWLGAFPLRRPRK